MQLDYNKLRSPESLRNLSEVPSLQALNVNNNMIESPDFIDSIKGLKNLSVLRMIGNDVINSFCSLVSKNLDVQPVALEQLKKALSDYGTNQPLVQIASYCIGEFETNDPNIIQVFLKTIVLPKQTGRTTCYILTALAKLGLKFNCVDTIMPCFQKFSSDNRLDVQQRAGEFLRLLKSPNAYQFLAPIAENNEEEAQPQQSQSKLSKPKQQETLDSLLDMTDEPPKQQKKKEKLPPQTPGHIHHNRADHRQGHVFLMALGELRDHGKIAFLRRADHCLEALQIWRIERSYRHFFPLCVFHQFR